MGVDNLEDEFTQESRWQSLYLAWKLWSSACFSSSLIHSGFSSSVSGPPSDHTRFSSPSVNQTDWFTDIHTKQILNRDLKNIFPHLWRYFLLDVLLQKINVLVFPLLGIQLSFCIINLFPGSLVHISLISLLALFVQSTNKKLNIMNTGFKIVP